MNVAGHGQDNAKIEILKEGLDGFSYISLIFIYFAFLPESSMMSEVAHYIWKRLKKKKPIYKLQKLVSDKGDSCLDW